MMVLNKEADRKCCAENNDVKRVIADEGLMIIMRISDIFLIIMALKLLRNQGKEGRKKSFSADKITYSHPRNIIVVYNS